MSKRAELRATYIQGWYELDIDKMLSAVREDFIFDDPAEPEPVTRSMLPAYVERWQRRTGNRNEWILTHEVRQDREGILTDWEWWQVVGTDLEGSAIVTTSDEGVFMERITYFDRSAAMS